MDQKGNIRIRNMLASIERTFLPVGSVIGKYRIIEEIDRGGMAVVYKALQLDLDREVALKVMPANITINRRFVERFLTEAHAVAKLNHPNIVNIHEVAMENNIYYLVMDYIPGKNLYYFLHYNKPKLVDVLEIVSRLADALQYAHDRKIIHRDLKLNNVIMKDRLTPVLIDFGLAKALEGDELKSGGGITRTGEIMGSPSYMAPERILGGVVDHRSDICSLGIMMYEMLTFKNPYLDQRNLHQTTINVMEANPIPPRKLVPWLPAEIEAITLKAMAKSASDRYQSMAAFREDIMRYQRGEPVEAKPPSFFKKVRHFARRYWEVLVIAGVILAFSALFGFSLYQQSKRGKSHWQLIINEKFGNRLDTDEWILNTDSMFTDTSWCVSGGLLHGKSKKLSHLQLKRHFNCDILVECDIIADSMDLFNAGIYLFGCRPDSGYRFYFNHRGEGKHGICFPGSNYLFYDVDPSKVPISNINHIVIERIQNSISYSVNGIVVSRVWDFLPPLGKNHEKIGLFIEGSNASFDNFKVFRRAIPQAPSPTLIADRFVERGDIEGAIDEYKNLSIDFSNADIAGEILIKKADCLIRLQRYDEAQAILKKISTLKNKDESITARRLFLEEIIYDRLGEKNAADSLLRLLAVRYPSNPANLSAILTALLRCSKKIETGALKEAYREITAMTDYYKKFPSIWGKLHLNLLQKYIEKGSLDTACSIAEDVIRLYAKEEGIVAAAKIAQGNINLHRGLKDKAKELFDLCITAHLNAEGIWEAWMALADIYKYDFQFNDALTIYRKIRRECQPGSIFKWMASIEAADLMGRKNVRQRDSLLSTVVSEPHPFPVPRLIARFYLGEIRENEFKEKWDRFFPKDRTYLFYLARKAAINKEQIIAGLFLNELKRSLPKQRWDYFKAMKIINNLENW